METGRGYLYNIKICVDENVVEECFYFFSNIGGKNSLASCISQYTMNMSSKVPCRLNAVSPCASLFCMTAPPVVTESSRPSYPLIYSRCHILNSRQEDTSNMQQPSLVTHRPKILQNHKLSLSKLKLPPLLLLRTTPNLKYFSSPVAVRPPIYHFSAPSTSLKPSELLSLPRLPLGLAIYLPLCCSALGDVEGVCVPGDVLNGLAECVRGEWRVERAAAVAPGFVDVVIVRGFEVCVEEVVCAG